MGITGGVRYWPSEPGLERREYAPLKGDEICEAIIVGGGVTGILCAYEMVRLGIDTVLIEKGELADASTSANAGLLQVCGDRMLSALIESIGERDAVSVYRMCRESVDRLEAICAELDEEVGFVRRSSLYYASSASDVSALRCEGETLRRYGFRARIMEAEEIARTFPFRKELALLIDEDAEVNPLRLALALADKASKHGLRLYERTESLRLAADGNGVVVHTGGGTIRAKHAVLAPGYETQYWLPSRGVELVGTYAIATEPIDLSIWSERCLIWETAKPYLYMRTTPDGRAILGGFDAPFADTAQRDGRLKERTKKLLQAFGELFPPYAGVRAEYAWCGTFADTDSGLPLFQVRPELPRSLFALGYGGNGTVYSMLVASRAASWVRTGGLEGLKLFEQERMTVLQQEAGR